MTCCFQRCLGTPLLRAWYSPAEAEGFSSRAGLRGLDFKAVLDRKGEWGEGESGPQSGMHEPRLGWTLCTCPENTGAWGLEHRGGE